MRCLCTLLFLLVCGQAFCQKTRFEIKAGTGAGECPYINTYYPPWYENNNLKHEDNQIYSIEVLYSITKRIKAGPAMLHQRYDVIFIPGFFSGERKHLVEQTKVTGFVCSGYYDIEQKTRRRLYTGLAAGPAFTRVINYEKNTTANSVTLAYQLTAFGISWGRRAGFFMEAGYGYKGILAMGLFVKM